MQTLIYTDASLKENENGIAIEIKIEKKSYFFRFRNIKFKEGQYNSNNVEALGVLFGIALASQYDHKKVFIFNDNIVAIKKIHQIESEIDKIFNQFTNIQFGWFQNDMPQLQKVDYLSRVDFKYNKEFDLSQIKYKEILFDDNLLFNLNDFSKYLEHNCLLLKRLMGFEPKVEDLNTMLIDNMYETKNKHQEKELVKTFDPSFKIKEKTIVTSKPTSLISKTSQKIIENKNSTTSFVTEQEVKNIINSPLDKTPKIIKSKFKKDTIKKIKSLHRRNDKIFKENNIINKEDKEILFCIKGKFVPYIYKELVEQNLIRFFIDKTKCTKFEETLILKIVKNNENDLENYISIIEECDNKKYIMIFIKIFNIEKFNLILKKSKILKRKDYRRSVGSIIKYYNKKGVFF